MKQQESAEGLPAAAFLSCFMWCSGEAGSATDSRPGGAGMASPVYDMTGLQLAGLWVAVPTSHSLRWLSVEALTMLSLPSQRT